mgnify:CR=1 FL=1
MQVKLSNRQQQVLGATIRQYIATARPVGSEALVDEFQPKVSPATIRNAMGHLEKAGLLYQPHTSAGRVPSDSGYRIYVDQLITPSDTVARQVDHLLSHRLKKQHNSLETLLRGAAQLLASLSGYIVLIAMPKPSQTCLRHLQMVQVEPGRVLLVVVLDSYETESTVMNLPLAEDGQECSQWDAEAIERELQIVSNFLNTHLRGRSLREIASLDWSDLGQQFDHYADLIRASVSELNRRCKDLQTSPQLLITGVAEVLRRQPEFAEIQQIQPIMHLLESEPEQLLSLIFASLNEEISDRRVRVRIGSENPLEMIQSCALVSATYHRGKTSVGSVGLLGPTRMVYENAIAFVETAADYLSETLSQS